MKRITLLLLAIIIAIPTFGQLKVKSASKGWETVKSFNMHNVELMLNKQDSTYFFGVKSDNQFDGYIYIQLGKTNEDCIQTLNDILALYDIDKDSSVTIDSYADSALITMGPVTLMGIKYLMIKQEHQAGKHLLYKPYIKSMVKYFGGVVAED